MYELKTVTYADADNPAAVKLYKDLLVEAILHKLKENGKPRWGEIYTEIPMTARSLYCEKV